MNKVRPTIKFLVAAAMLACAATGQAAILNGDFAAGGSNWQVTQPGNWTISFPAAGGNPGGWGSIQSPFGGAGGTGCIMQTFICGDQGQEGTCTITFDYFLRQIDAGDFTGRIQVRAGGAVFTFAPTDDGWHRGEIRVPCGVVVLELCLQVDPTNNGWLAGFDNVMASCDGVVADEATPWGNIKALYR